jgi:hypothetical protein
MVSSLAELTSPLSALARAMAKAESPLIFALLASDLLTFTSTRAAVEACTFAAVSDCVAVD